MQRLTWKSLGVLIVPGVLAVGGTVATPQRVWAQDTAKVANPAPPKKAKKGGANLILESEIEPLTEENAFDIIQLLRPNMLRARSPNSFSEAQGGGIVVYVDNARTGGTETLTNVSRSMIKEIRFINATDATQRFGVGHPSGAILISTRR